MAPRSEIRVRLAFCFVIVAIFEESYVAGYLQFTLTRGIGFGGSPVAFAPVWIPPTAQILADPRWSVWGAAVGHGFLLALVYGCCGGRWVVTPAGTGDSYFYGTSDSGLVAEGHLLGEHPIGNGLDARRNRPEGSLLALGVRAIMALFIGSGGEYRRNPRSLTTAATGWSRKPALQPTAAPWKRET